MIENYDRDQPFMLFNAIIIMFTVLISEEKDLFDKI